MIFQGHFIDVYLHVFINPFNVLVYPINVSIQTSSDYNIVRYHACHKETHTSVYLPAQKIDFSSSTLAMNEEEEGEEKVAGVTVL